jgi:hypothetical protein
MRQSSLCFSVLIVVIFIVMPCWAQTPATATATVPPLIKFSGTLANTQGTVGVTFALYTAIVVSLDYWQGILGAY